MEYVFLNMSNLEDWKRGIVNRNFFIVEEILRRPETKKVLLIDFLAIQPKKRLFGKMRTLRYAMKMFTRDTGRLAGWSHKIIPAEGIFSEIEIEPQAFVGAGFLRPEKSTMRLLDRSIDQLGFNREQLILWNYNPFVPAFFALKAKLKIFDAVDDWTQHPRFKKDWDLLAQNYQTIDQQADLIFTVSDTLTQKFSNPSTYWIPNGVDTVRIQPGLLVNQKPVVGYVGTIEERIDFDLLEELLKRHQDKEFVLYGPVWDSVKPQVAKLRAAYANVRFPGRVRFTELSDLLASIDVGIVPHKRNGLSASMNPMKIYEYLAAGKPVVSTVSTGLDYVDEELAIAADPAKFSEQIARVLRENTPEKILSRVELVSLHSWNARVGMMLAHIKKKW